MGMVVRTNTMALNAYRQLGMNNSAVAKSLEKLSSGFRINRAGDDAAGLAISEKMKAQITGLETASSNAQDGISLIQTAEGALTEVHSMLNRMVELATKSANGTYTQTERDALQSEVDALLTEIDRISQSTNFNGANLLDGSLSKNGKIVDSAERILKDVLASGENAVDFTGIKTVLDSIGGGEETKTKFAVDFTGLKAGSAGKGDKVTPTKTPAAGGADATAAILELDFKGQTKDILDTKSLTIAGQEFKFDKTGTATAAGTEIMVDISTATTADAIATKLQAAIQEKIDDNTLTDVAKVEVNGTKVTLTGAIDEATGAASQIAFDKDNIPDGGTVNTVITTVEGADRHTDADVANGTVSLVTDSRRDGNSTSAAEFTLELASNVGTTAGGKFSIRIGGKELISNTVAANKSGDDFTGAFEGQEIELCGKTFKVADYGAGSNKIKLVATENGEIGEDFMTGLDLSTLDVQIASTADTVTVDFSSKTGNNIIGETVEIGGKTFEFVKTGGTLKDPDSGNVKVEIDTGAVDTAIAAALLNAAKKQQLEGVDMDSIALATGNKGVVFTSTTLGDDSELTAKATSSTGKIVTVGDATKEGVNAGAATPATATVDFTDKTGEKLLGSTVTINGKTYEFIEAGGELSADTNIGVTITKEDDAAALATALLTAANADADSKGANIANVDLDETGTKVVFTTNITDPDDTTLEVGSEESADSAVKFNFSVGGKNLVEDVAITKGMTETEIAQAVFDKLKGDNAEATTTIGDANYKVDIDGGKLVFELQDDPTEENIAGNFKWDLEVTSDKGEILGNHTAGTIVIQAGNVQKDSQRANTVFRIDAADIKDGATIKIDNMTVILQVGKNSKTEKGKCDAVIDLKTFEEKDITDADLDVILSKISEGFGADGTENFIVGVNSKDSKAEGDEEPTKDHDFHRGLTIHKKDVDKKYDTLKKLEDVFTLSTKGNGGALVLQIGDTADSFNKMEVDVGDMSAFGLGLKGLSVATREDASGNLDTIKTAINNVSSARAKMGALQNRLEHTINNLDVAVENLSSANSRIRDTDMAKEMMNYTKMNVLVQSAQAMLAQANQQPQSVLQLLQ